MWSRWMREQEGEFAGCSPNAASQVFAYLSVRRNQSNLIRCIPHVTLLLLSGRLICAYYLNHRFNIYMCVFSSSQPSTTLSFSLLFLETVVRLRGIQSRGNPAEKRFWLESILAGGACCSRDESLNHTVSEKLCAYLIQKWSSQTAN